MIINDLADELDIKKGDICKQLMAIKNISPEILIKRRDRLYQGTVLLDETFEKVLSILKTLGKTVKKG